MKPTACLTILLTTAISMANPAVSELNGKFGILHGSMNSESMTSVEGGITWPFQECLGIQLELEVDPPSSARGPVPAGKALSLIPAASSTSISRVKRL